MPILRCSRSNMETKDLEFKKYMLDEDFNREKFYEKFPNARTFPQIIVDGELVGGYQEFNQYVQTKSI
ncbi:MAG: hypothetical protein Ct9H90mP22_8340 [Gammaproteobacteria bacterium]|nr:MAG: hypothetical protein Ct9H90mP22_8340 [Gammaproteobacteria bacterium]